MGYLYWKSNQFDEAERQFKNQLALDPSNALALAYLGDLEMKRSHHEKALAYLRQAVQLREDIRIAYMDLGIILAEAKQYAEAIDALQRAAELDPAQPDAHYRLGRVYQNMGNKSAAQQELNKVQELHKAADEDMASQMARAAGRNSSQ